MTQSTLPTRCDFREGGFACTLQADHAGPHFGQYLPTTEPAAAETAPAAPDTDGLLAAIFGDALENGADRMSFYGLGDHPDAIPDLTAHVLDKALAMVRLGEKWDEDGAFDLLPELQRSRFFKSVVSDFAAGTRDAGHDLAGRSYYLGQLCLRLLSAGYLVGAWTEGGK